MDVFSVFSEIGIPVQSGTITAQELAALFRGYLTGLHRGSHPSLHVSHKLLGIILNIIEYLVDGLAVYYLVNLITVLVYAYMHRIRVAEKIVHIAKYLLIGSDQKYTYIIRLLILYIMDRQRAGSAVARYII